MVQSRWRPGVVRCQRRPFCVEPHRGYTERGRGGSGEQPLHSSPAQPRNGQFTIVILSILHFVWPPKFCINIVFNLSWVLRSSQNKLKTILLQNLLGVNKVYIPAMDKFSPLTVPEVFAKVTRPSLTLVSKVVTGTWKEPLDLFFFFWGGGWGGI